MLKYLVSVFFATWYWYCSWYWRHRAVLAWCWRRRCWLHCKTTENQLTTCPPRDM